MVTLLDGGAVDVLDPAGVEIVGQRLLGGHAHHVEPQRLAAAVLDAEHRLRRVVEREAVRRHEGEAEPRMQEAASAHDSLRSDPRRRACRRCRRDRPSRSRLPPPGPVNWRALICALRTRSGVAGCDDRKSGMRVDRRRRWLAAAQIGLASERGQEAHRAERIVAGARGDADADAVGLELLRAREGRERDLRLRQRERVHVRIGAEIVEHAADQRDLPRAVLAHRGVAARSRAPSRATAPRRARRCRWRARSGRGSRRAARSAARRR